MSEPISDFDGAWKEATEVFLPQIFQLLRPEIHRGIDWSRPPVYLDTELRKVSPDAEHGRQHPDRLISVTRVDANAEDALLHLEAQSQQTPEMALRMFRYHTRLFELRGRPAVSLAILADDDPNWRPTFYEHGLWGCRTRFEFLSCKLLDFSDEELFESPNPIAKLILAQRIAHRTSRNSPKRFRLKLRWLDRLLEQGFSEGDTPRLFRMLERMVPLSRDLDIEFHRQLNHYRTQKTMTFITTFEQFAMEKGLSQGLSQGLSKGREEGLQSGWTQAIKSLWQPGFRTGILNGTSTSTPLRTRRASRNGFDLPGPFPPAGNSSR
ncbi:MAG: hypothetical protein ACKPGI_13695 [Verrucomicrobiota bacterium]